MRKSTRSRKSNKSDLPEKPYEGFPLTAHRSGRWCKKIRGKLHYFGRWGYRQNGEVAPVDNLEESASEALEQFNREWPYLKEGRTPPPLSTDADALTIGDLSNLFLNGKRMKLESGELSRTSFADYFRTCRLLVNHFGTDRRVDDLRPDDFSRLRDSMAKRWSPTTLRNEINRVRVVFKFAFDERLIDRPVHYGQSFNRPSAKQLRRVRNEAGPRLFEADEIRRILNAADVQMRAMILLGINCGFGNTDVARLPHSAVDLNNGWIEFPRPKTEIPRRVPLWPETVDAIREAIDQRPEPKNPEDADCVFLTVQGNRWVRTKPHKTDDGKFSTVNTLAHRFGGLLRRLHINGRKGLGFYTLRHNFQTIGGEAKDPDAVAAIMGHIDTSMGAVYRERISDERLQAVVEIVRNWLAPWIIGTVELRTKAARDAVKRLSQG